MTKYESKLVSVPPHSRVRSQDSIPEEWLVINFQDVASSNLAFTVPHTTLQPLIKWLGVTGGFQLYLG